MDIAAAVIYCKHSNSVEKFASTSTADASDFEILLEDVRIQSVAGGFIPSDDRDLRTFPSSSLSSSATDILSTRRSPLLSQENYGENSHQTSSFRSSSPHFRKSSPAHGSHRRFTDSRNSNFSNKIVSGDGPTKLVKQLPRHSITFDQEPNEIASIFSSNLLSHGSVVNNSKINVFRRAVPVALWCSEPSSPYNIFSSENVDSHSLTPAGLSAALFCVPVTEKGKIVCACSTENHVIDDRYSNGKNAKLREDNLSAGSCACRYRFHAFDKLLGMCRNASTLIDPETRHLLLRLEEWLKEKSKNEDNFLQNLFLRPTSSSRLLSCVHNPAHSDEWRSCSRTAIRVRPAVRASQTTDLTDEVRSANTTLARMMAVEKCDRFIMNPLFGSGLPYRVKHDQQIAPHHYEYVAKGRPTLSLPSRQSDGSGSHLTADCSDAGSWIDDHPLHRAAQMGQTAVVRQLLAQNYDANQMDRDHWTPLHYAAWYGHLGAVQALINYGQHCSVNIRNKNGSTPLHFASYCGHHYVVELLLSHPNIEPFAVDSDGKTPLDLCESVPKPAWQAIAILLRSRSPKNVEQTPKIQVDLMDGSNAMLMLANGADTTADELHQQMCKELQFSEECGKLFALWLCSESLQLQLKGDHKPVQHLQKWKGKLSQWSDIADTVDYDEKAHLVFRRDARVHLKDEKKVKFTDTALALLYHEANQNFLQGFYPCVDHDIVMLAATVMQIINGDHDSKRDKQFLANEKSLSKIVPAHKLKDKTSNWIPQIMTEHKHVSAKSPKSLTTLQYRYLSFCQNLRLYGSAFFTALMFVDKPVKGALYVHVGINDAGLHLINCETKALYRSFEYTNLIFTFQTDRPFIKFRGKDGGSVHDFTLKTKQASMINTLLKRFTDQQKTSVVSGRSTPSGVSAAGGTVIVR